ncbi:hypothetical protein CBR_g982 [Chara braunii]|uniref:Cytoplasmic tRNA 2-thiolation protein 2 n=1 Tax=Chara braunii TaxID=69332 RepID=A0A388KCR9_CHABU|nr:hypothetical protein CBR_g982 [Chara braunii]|eukprot:GBG67862.1 hypothetical protein CBR_g982 [Chara braunii]
MIRGCGMDDEELGLTDMEARVGEGGADAANRTAEDEYDDEWQSMAEGGGNLEYGGGAIKRACAERGMMTRRDGGEYRGGEGGAEERACAERAIGSTAAEARCRPTRKGSCGACGCRPTSAGIESKGGMKDYYCKGEEGEDRTAGKRSCTDAESLDDKRECVPEGEGREKERRGVASCVKCESMPAEAVINQHEHVCRGCLKASLFSKFRTAISKHSLVCSDDRLLVAFSGGHASRVALDFVHQIQSTAKTERELLEERGRIRFQFGVAFVDESAAGGTPLDKAIEMERCIESVVHGHPYGSRIAYHHTCLEDLFIDDDVDVCPDDDDDDDDDDGDDDDDDDADDDDKVPGHCDDVEELQKIRGDKSVIPQMNDGQTLTLTLTSHMECLDIGDVPLSVMSEVSHSLQSHLGSNQDDAEEVGSHLGNDQNHNGRWRMERRRDARGVVEKMFKDVLDSTGRQDLVVHLRSLLLQKVAKKNGYTKILQGDSATRLAVHALAATCKGRGYSLPADVQFLDRRWDIPVIRPLRECLAKELATHARKAMLKTVFIPNLATLRGPQFSIDALADAFVNVIQEDLPSRVHTILRTAGKLKSFALNNDICDGLLRQGSHSSQGTLPTQTYETPAGASCVHNRSSEVIHPSRTKKFLGTIHGEVLDEEKNSGIFLAWSPDDHSLPSSIPVSVGVTSPPPGGPGRRPEEKCGTASSRSAGSPLLGSIPGRVEAETVLATDSTVPCIAVQRLCPICGAPLMPEEMTRFPIKVGLPIPSACSSNADDTFQRNHDTFPFPERSNNEKTVVAKLSDEGPGIGHGASLRNSKDRCGAEIQNFRGGKREQQDDFVVAQLCCDSCVRQFLTPPRVLSGQSRQGADKRWPNELSSNAALLEHVTKTRVKDERQKMWLLERQARAR